MNIENQIVIILLNRLNIYPITKISKQTGRNTIRNIPGKKEYNANLIEEPVTHPQNQNIHTEPMHHMTKLATSTYCGKVVRRITKRFKSCKYR
jgi:hypothetical protein